MAASDAAPAKLCLVVSTIGKTDRFDRLLDSLVAQTDQGFVLGLCDQSPDGSVARRVAARELGFEHFVVTSGPGASAGRNAVMRAAPASCTHFWFPNDSSELPPDLVAQVAQAAAGYDITVLTYVDDDGPRQVFPPGHTALNPTNAWRVNEPCLVLARGLAEALGGFDESLGPGAPTPFQACEAGDLMLRAVDHHPSLNWRPDLRILGVTQGYGLSPRARCVKQLGYGRGFGEVLRRHGNSVVRRLAAVAGPFSHRPAWRSRQGWAEALWSAIGRWQGAFPRWARLCNPLLPKAVRLRRR